MSIIIGIIALVMIFSLQKRIEILEKEIQKIQGHQPLKTPESEREQSPVAYSDIRAHGELSPHEIGAQTGETTAWEASPVEARNVPNEHSFIDWIQKDFMVKLGGFLLLLAFGWFVSYAFAHNWIGPVGRITLGLLAGVAFMALGVWRITARPHQGGIFAVLGSTIIMLTVFAAREIYNFFDPYSALFIMFLSVACVAFISVRFNRNTLALAGLFLASIAPLFTNAPAPDVVGLYVYLFAITLGTLWVVFVRSWSNLTLMAFVVVFLHGIPYLESVRENDQDIALFFAFVFTAIFFIANIAGLMRNHGAENKQAHIVTAIGTGMYLILWILSAAAEEWQSLLLVAWMLVFSIGSFIVYRICADRAAFYIYGGTSVALLGVATAIELSGTVLTIAFAFEISVLVLLVVHLLPQIHPARVLSGLFVLPVVLSLESVVASEWSRGVLHEHFFIVVLMMTLLGFTGYVLHTQEKIKDPEEDGSAGGILMVAAALYGLALIWLVFHVRTLFSYEAGTMIALVVYTLIGLWMYITGKRTQKSWLAKGGGILLGCVIARLLLVEVWNMELSGRIVTFLVIGSLLVSTAFIKRGNKTEVTHN